MVNRRGFLTGLVSALAAPAIVRSGILMPLRGVMLPESPGFIITPGGVLMPFPLSGYLYSDEFCDALRQTIQPLTKFESRIIG